MATAKKVTIGEPATPEDSNKELVGVIKQLTDYKRLHRTVRKLAEELEIDTKQWELNEAKNHLLATYFFEGLYKLLPPESDEGDQ